MAPDLHRHKTALAIFSACESATQGEELLGSVAAGLLAAGVPAVLAMTTEAFFGAFYQALGDGQPPGLALNHARDHPGPAPGKTTSPARPRLAAAQAARLACVQPLPKRRRPAAAGAWKCRY